MFDVPTLGSHYACRTRPELVLTHVRPRHVDVGPQGLRAVTSRSARRLPMSNVPPNNRPQDVHPEWLLASFLGAK